jgi:hypothetical protein
MTARLMTVVSSIALLLISTGECFALQAVLTVKDFAVISNEADSSEIRVLARFELPEFLRSADIFYAQVTGKVEIDLAEREGASEVEALPVTTEWNGATVTWTHPWNTPGGDVDGSFARGCIVRGGTQPIRIDITPLVVEWASGTRPNNGVLIGLSDLFGGIFALPAGNGGGNQGRQVPIVKVWYLPKLQQ